jgi:hypothetical protein
LDLMADRRFSSPWRVDETLRLQPTVTALKTVFLSRQAGDKPQILRCASAILLGPDVGAPNVLPFFTIGGGEHVNALLPRTPL